MSFISTDFGGLDISIGWRQHGIDGAFLQRFATEVDADSGNEGTLRTRDEVGDRVREAAEKEGRVFAIMLVHCRLPSCDESYDPSRYDISAVAPDRIQHVIERDWLHLMRDKGILNSPTYLREKGKPVVGIWGMDSLLTNLQTTVKPN
jgi:hypothetical protein